MFIQYAGDYREAVQRFEANGDETYGYQRFSVNTVAKLTEKFDRVSVLCISTPEPYCEILHNGVQAIGAGVQDNTLNINEIIQCVQSQQPDRLIVRTPYPSALLRWAIRRKIPTLAAFADSFQQNGLKSRVKNFLFARTLNHPCIEWVANHNIGSCVSLKNIGVEPNKILPWDWPANKTPEQIPIKQLDSDTSEITIFYAGMLMESKGVGDLLDAVALLRTDGISVKLNIAGSGELHTFVQRAKDLKIADIVNFLGLVPHHQVVSTMMDSDLVTIPSRTEYPEGMPKTINEALCTRTPMVISNHPVFERIFENQKNAMIFESGNPQLLAQRIRELLTDPGIYTRLSEASLQTWKQIQIPLKWDALLEHWLERTAESKTILEGYSLESGTYKFK
jgi:glycosyltransferase involved in cell wall biosynthesis